MKPSAPPQVASSETRPVVGVQLPYADWQPTSQYVGLEPYWVAKAVSVKSSIVGVRPKTHVAGAAAAVPKGATDTSHAVTAGPVAQYSLGRCRRSAGTVPRLAVIATVRKSRTAGRRWRSVPAASREEDLTSIHSCCNSFPIGSPSRCISTRGRRKCCPATRPNHEPLQPKRRGWRGAAASSPTKQTRGRSKARKECATQERPQQPSSE